MSHTHKQHTVTGRCELKGSTFRYLKFACSQIQYSLRERPLVEITSHWLVEQVFKNLSEVSSHKNNIHV